MTKEESEAYAKLIQQAQTHRCGEGRDGSCGPTTLELQLSFALAKLMSEITESNVPEDFEVKEIPDHEYASYPIKVWDIGDDEVFVSMNKPTQETIRQLKALKTEYKYCDKCKEAMSWTPQGYNCFRCNYYGPDDMCTT